MREQDTIRGVQIRAHVIYIYIYIWTYVCHNSSACHAYVLWAELGHSHFCLGTKMGTKNVLKGKRALAFLFSIQSS